ncbi:hypothetical protein F5Y11DRAFT_295160 [Daldinia sp. FL1419]|nr:hypothetical protein F5Y11DRAFT_295160 [Daldinia sp. FL1419]
MAVFSRDLILEIAQNLDIKSMLALGETNKENNSLIKTYEHSLSLSRIATFPVPPTGNVLTSEVYLRRPLKHGNFAMVLELERRRSRIAEVLTASPHFNIKCPPGLGELTHAQQDFLRELLERAFSHCDSIADIAANLPHEVRGAKWYERRFVSWWEDRQLLEGFRMNDPYTNYVARPVQREYIRGLCKQDLTMIYYLVHVMASAFTKSRKDWIDSDPTFWERITVFEEYVLRHGSWYAWAHFIGNDEWQDMATSISRIGLAELTRFEFGHEDALPSLQSELILQFNELYDSSDNSIKALHAAVKGLVVESKDRPDDQGEKRNEVRNSE